MLKIQVKKASSHHDISHVLLLTHKLHMKTLAFFFSLQFRMSFPPKASKLFRNHNICFLTRANDDVCLAVSVTSRVTARGLQIVQHYFCSCQFSKIVLESKIHLKVQYVHRIQASVHTCVTGFLSARW